jgi:hypothetical protein
VADLLAGFNVHPLEMSFGPELSEFVSRTSEPALQTWDAVLVNADNDQLEIDLEGYKIHPVARFVDSNREGVLRISGSKQRVGTPGLEREGLPIELVTKIRDEYRKRGNNGTVPDSEYRPYRTRPLLLIYAVNAYRPRVKKGVQGEPLDLGVGQLYALGLSFPEFDDTGISEKVKYRVNLVEWRSIVEAALDDETEDDETESLDED